MSHAAVVRTRPAMFWPFCWQTMATADPLRMVARILPVSDGAVRMLRAMPPVRTVAPVAACAAPPAPTSSAVAAPVAASEIRARRRVRLMVLIFSTSPGNWEETPETRLPVGSVCYAGRPAGPWQARHAQATGLHLCPTAQATPTREGRTDPDSTPGGNP